MATRLGIIESPVPVTAEKECSVVAMNVLVVDRILQGMDKARHIAGWHGNLKVERAADSFIVCGIHECLQRAPESCLFAW